jgi:hypothetical protein
MEKRKHLHSSANSYDFLRLLWEGYPNFQKKLDADIMCEEKKKIKSQRSFVILINEVKDKLPEFIANVYHTLYKCDYDSRKYCYTIMELFINEFLSKTDARFSLREYDILTNSMKCLICTDPNVIPAPIPLKKKNMIQLAAERNSPILYSRNKEWHCRGNGSIENGKYTNYVTHCLLKSKDNKPYLSICLDVKDKASDRLIALYDSNILSIIFKAMEIKVLLEQVKIIQKR